MGSDKKNIAEILDTASSVRTDTPDFWRREGADLPSHGGRFTGEPAYFKHITNATKLLFEQTGFKPEDFDYAVFHQPDGKFPLVAAKMLGFSEKQVKDGLVTPVIGNTYSGASLLGLASYWIDAGRRREDNGHELRFGTRGDSFAIK